MTKGGGKMKIFRNRRAQNTLEYLLAAAVIITIIVAFVNGAFRTKVQAAYDAAINGQLQ